MGHLLRSPASKPLTRNGLRARRQARTTRNPVSSFWLHSRRMPPPAHLIIGGGIAGAATAYFLARRGAGSVLVLDREERLVGIVTDTDLLDYLCS